MTFLSALAPCRLRAWEWSGGAGKDAAHHRCCRENQGPPTDPCDGRPLIGIGNLWSRLTCCTVHPHNLAEKAASGLHEAGGLQREFPVMVRSHPAFGPAAMMLRAPCACDARDIDGRKVLINGKAPDFDGTCKTCALQACPGTAMRQGGDHAPPEHDHVPGAGTGAGPDCRTGRRGHVVARGVH